MQTNRNYRHRAANLVADSYISELLFPLAYWWRVRAAERYRFGSWCGTCSDSAEAAISIELTRDAALAGPLVLAGHMIVFPGRTSYLWFLIVISAAVTAKRWRRQI